MPAIFTPSAETIVTVCTVGTAEGVDTVFPTAGELPDGKPPHAAAKIDRTEKKMPLSLGVTMSYFLLFSCSRVLFDEFSGRK